MVQRREVDGHVEIKGIARGMIFWADVPHPHAVGREQFNEPQKPRPWVVVSSNSVHQRRQLVIAAPMTWRDDVGLVGCCVVLREGEVIPQPTSGPRVESKGVILIEQVRALSHARLKGAPVGVLHPRRLPDVDAALLFALGIRIPRASTPTS